MTVAVAIAPPAHMVTSAAPGLGRQPPQCPWPTSGIRGLIKTRTRSTNAKGRINGIKRLPVSYTG